MSIFTKYAKEWNEATAPAQQRYFKNGTYLIDLHKFVEGESRRDGTPYAAVEGTVLEVLHGDEESNSPGERISWVIMMRNTTTFFNALRMFTSAVSNIPFDDCTIEMAGELAQGDGSAVRGLEVIADANTITTQKGNPFMKVIWRSTND